MKLYILASAVAIFICSLSLHAGTDDTSMLAFLLAMFRADFKAANRFVRGRCANASQMIHPADDLWMDEFKKYHRVLAEEFDTFVTRCGGVPQFHDNEHFSNGPSTKRALASGRNVSKIWGAVWLKVWGEETELGKQFFPRSLEAIRATPLNTAMVSVLNPGHGVDWHCGYFSGILRYHLGIRVPQSSSREETPYLLVCDTPMGDKLDCPEHKIKMLEWTEGDDLVFDDTFVHMVENPSKKMRIVLFSDFVRTDCDRMASSFLWTVASQLAKRFVPRVKFLIKDSNTLADICLSREAGTSPPIDTLGTIWRHPGKE